MAIDAVFIEVVEKDEAASATLSKKIKGGPFAGIFVRKEKGTDTDDFESFVVVFSTEGNKKALDIYNTRYYNITAIEMVKSDHTHFIFYKNDEKDQIQAFGKATEILAEMQDEGRVLADKEIIDIATYKNLDKHVGVASAHVNTSAYGAKKTAVYSHYKAPARNTTTATKKARMSVIKRKKGRAKKSLTRMYEAVRSITEGTYEAPKLRKAPEADDFKETEKKEQVGATVVNDDDDDFYTSGAWYM